MASGAADRLVLDTFRAVWVRGRLDYQRAVEALEEATLEADRVRAIDAAASEQHVRRAEERVEHARRRVAETEAALGQQFDRFCRTSR